MEINFVNLFVCPECDGALFWSEENCVCNVCGGKFPFKDGFPRFVSGSTHENFAIQWKKFADVQLDSKNKTICSRDRLLDQTEMRPEEFKGKTILEVGCGAGRFTEILLGFGAKVASVDYSAAVEACAESNKIFRKNGQLVNAQADVFALPFQKSSFDIVVGLGMLQHTGNAKEALQSLWEHVKPGGILIVDRYQISFRSWHPLKYFVRFFIRRFPAMTILKWAQATCDVFIPIERFMLRHLQGGRGKKYFRFIFNRSLNSVFPLNLEIEGKLDADTAYRWSVLDTFDMWAPRYDEPATFSTWQKELLSLPDGQVLVCKNCGQGNAGLVRRGM